MVSRDVDPKQGFRPKSIKLSVSNEKLVGSSGLGTIIDLFDGSPLSREFAKCLPERKSNRSGGSYRLGLILLASLVSDHDCLDDLEEFEDDVSLEDYFCGEIPVPKTMGDFLRDFTSENLVDFSSFLSRMAFGARNHVASVVPALEVREYPEFMIDSTVHEQHGDKIEGCAHNYEGIWCLNSQVIFDELGLCYAGQLQAGNAKPGIDGDQLLLQALEPLKAKKLRTPFTKLAHVNADSAYVFEDFIRACMATHSTFAIAARENIHWKVEIERIEKWEKWVHSENSIKKWQKRDKNPPEIYLGRYHWEPSWAPQLKFPVIIKKEWEADELFPGAGSWKYHAVITNESLHKFTMQDVYERYLRRANGENFIREAKHNFDAKHLPCLKFEANHAYLLFILLAQNLLRWVALIEKPNKPHFAKKLRRKFVFSAGKFVKHARTVTLRVSKKFYQEVQRLIEAWQGQPTTIPAHAPSG